MPSNSAKAAALLVFTSGVPDFETAVKVYDQLEQDDLPVQETLDKFGSVCRWEQVESMDETMWWDEVTTLATSIDRCRAHFKE